MTKADEIRLASSRNVLHALVRDNWASPRGLCNCSTTGGQDLSFGVLFCQRDYGHEGPHINGLNQWQAPWPPPQLYHGDRSQGLPLCAVCSHVRQDHVIDFHQAGSPLPQGVKKLCWGKTPDGTECKCTGYHG